MTDAALPPPETQPPPGTQSPPGAQPAPLPAWPVAVRHVTEGDAAAVRAVAVGTWGRTFVVGRDTVFDLMTLPALLAERAGRAVGLLAYQIADNAEDKAIEVVSISALDRTTGVGTALLDAATRLGTERGCRRLWLLTTNDNLDALRFYQRRGLRIVAVEAGAADRARELEPDIPMVGEYGIPLRDELILEMPL
jgi:ribosomal protein S18 acetylase RimI-like enzyme